MIDRGRSLKSPGHYLPLTVPLTIFLSTDVGIVGFNVPLDTLDIRRLLKRKFEN